MHAVITLLFNAVLYVLVHFWWYPGFYASLLKASGICLATVLASALAGPFLSWIIYKKDLIRDLMVIVALQFGVFTVGAHLLYAERPIFLVYSVDRFVVVTGRAIEEKHISPLVVEDYLTQPAPLVVAAYLPKLRGMDDVMKVISDGGDIEFQPALYEPIERQRSLIERKGVDMSHLKLSLELDGFVSAKAFPLVNPKGEDVVLFFDPDSMRVAGSFNTNPWKVREMSD